jgi:3-deoxy-D-manno-octulosonate 8-phosphate phosphatase (KDO 8-P phosphatase)
VDSVVRTGAFEGGSGAPASGSDTLRQKAQRVRLVLTDGDGVLTDGGVYYSARGEEMKRFSMRDGMGVERLRRLAGLDVGIISGEVSPALEQRAKKLQIEELHLGIRDKLAVILEIAGRRGIGLEQIAFIGDDTNDLDAMRQVGLSACPADAMGFVRRIADAVCQCKGGHGAFRDLAELIILAQTEGSS